MFLTGGYENKMDENGRINLPVKLREGIGEQFYLCLDLSTQGQLECLSPEDFEEKGMVVNELCADDPDEVNMFFEYSLLINVDKQGRFVIPEKFRAKVGLGSNIMIIGMINRFIIKNNAATVDPSAEALREFNRKVANRVKEVREQKKAEKAREGMMNGTV